MNILLIELLVLWTSAFGMLAVLALHVARNGVKDLGKVETHSYKDHTSQFARSVHRLTHNVRREGIQFILSKFVPRASKFVLIGARLIHKNMSKIAHSFKRLEDFVNGKDAVREGAAASLFIKNIKLHKQSNNEKVSGAEKLELLD